MRRRWDCLLAQPAACLPAASCKALAELECFQTRQEAALNHLKERTEVLRPISGVSGWKGGSQVLGWLLEKKMWKREEKGLQSITLLPACVSRKTVSIFRSHKIHPRKSFSCASVSAFEKEQLGSSTLQCELGKGIYHVSLFLLLHLHRHTDHFLFSFLIRFPIYTVAVPFFTIPAVLAVRQCLVGRGILTVCLTALQKVCGV